MAVAALDLDLAMAVADAIPGLAPGWCATNGVRVVRFEPQHWIQGVSETGEVTYHWRWSQDAWCAHEPGTPDAHTLWIPNLIDLPTGALLVQHLRQRLRRRRMDIVYSADPNTDDAVQIHWTDAGGVQDHFGSTLGIAAAWALVTLHHGAAMAHRIRTGRGRGGRIPHAGTSPERPVPTAIDYVRTCGAFRGRYPLIGEGTARLVYQYTEDEVIKVPRNAEGTRANQTEAEIYRQEAKAHRAKGREPDEHCEYARCHLETLDGIEVLIMEVVERVRHKRWKGSMAWVNRTDRGQLGTTRNGRLVRFDYGG